jgi:hypothetical protein
VRSEGALPEVREGGGAVDCYRAPPAVQLRLGPVATAVRGVCVLWVRSYRVGDAIDFGRSPRHLQSTRNEGSNAPMLGCLASQRGRIWLTIFWPKNPLPEGEAWLGLRRFQPYTRFSWKTLGFHYIGMSDPTPDCAYHSAWAIPHASLVIVLLLRPIVLLIRGLKRRASNRQLRLGLCPSCGYDLRATPGSARSAGRRLRNRLPPCAARRSPSLQPHCTVSASLV